MRGRGDHDEWATECAKEKSERLPPEWSPDESTTPTGSGGTLGAIRGVSVQNGVRDATG